MAIVYHTTNERDIVFWKIIFLRLKLIALPFVHSCHATRTNQETRQGARPLDPLRRSLFKWVNGNESDQKATHLCQKSDRGAVGWLVAKQKGIRVTIVKLKIKALFTAFSSLQWIKKKLKFEDWYYHIKPRATLNYLYNPNLSRTNRQHHRSI